MNKLTALIGLGACVWLVFEAISPTAGFAKTPQIAQTYTDRLNLYLERQGNETYDALLRRATDAAMATAQQSFERDRQVSKIVVMVSAENNGLVAPILTLEVSRSDWENRIRPQRWITDLASSRTLLGFESSMPERVNSPTSTDLPRPKFSPPEPPGSPLWEVTRLRKLVYTYFFL